MLRLLGFCFKILLFSLAVIVIANWVEWRGRTLSDQVRIGLAHAERAPWIGKLPGEVRDWVEKKAHHARAAIRHADASTGSDKVHVAQSQALRTQATLASDAGAGETPRAAEDTIPASERQKLKALIRELNGSSAKGRD